MTSAVISRLSMTSAVISRLPRRPLLLAASSPPTSLPTLSRHLVWPASHLARSLGPVPSALSSLQLNRSFAGCHVSDEQGRTLRSGNLVTRGSLVASGNGIPANMISSRGLSTSTECLSRLKYPHFHFPLSIASKLARNRKERNRRLRNPYGHLKHEDYDEIYRDMPMMPRSVYKAFPRFEVQISGSRMTTDEEEIEKMFSVYGEVAKVVIPDQPLQSKEVTWIDRYRHGIVKFKCRSDYERALQAGRVHCKLGHQIDITEPPPDPWWNKMEKKMNANHTKNNKVEKAKNSGIKFH